MAAAARVDNVAALLGAGRGILPYAVLFYIIDLFIWYANPPGPANDANLAFNLLLSSVLVAGFFFMNFFRIRRAYKEPPPQPRVVYVPQPVYVQGPPPGYPGYAPPPGYPAYGYPQAPPPAPSALPPPSEEVPLSEPAQSAPPPRKRPPEGAP